MIERLEWWVTTARAARVVETTNRGRQVYGFMYEGSPHYAELRERSAQTHAIISKVLGRDNVPDIIRRNDDAYWVDAGMEFAGHALSVVRTRAETVDKLGSTAPTMRADALHPLVWGAASAR